MSCRTQIFPDGSVAILCGSRAGPKKCSAANCAGAVVALCDWKLHTVEGGKRRFSGARCNDALCERHRRRVDANKDLCPTHHERAMREGLVDAGEGLQKASS